MQPGVIESLEPRIAPAKISIIYTDADGDIVKITASRSGVVAPALSASNLVFTDGDPDGQLLSLTVTDPSFMDANISFTVKKKPGGDGLAHVGFIDATGIDLNRVTVKGDLGRILAGDAMTVDDPGLNLLSVRSMGTLGLTTQGGTGDLNTVIKGMLGALKVKNDLMNATVQVTGGAAADGKIGSVFIGGNLVGGEAAGSGKVSSSGGMGDVHVKGSVVGGMSESSGGIASNARIDRVRIDGDLKGGGVFSFGAMGDVRIGGDVLSGVLSTGGTIASVGGIGSVRIKGDLSGGMGDGSGRIASQGAIGTVLIGGDVTPGEGTGSGTIYGTNLIDRVQIKGDLRGAVSCLFGSIGQVKVGGDVIGTSSGTGLISGANLNVFIRGDLVGGSITGNESLLDSGAIVGSAIRVTIKGSIIAGTDESTGSILRSAGIFSGTHIESINIGGSLLGNDSAPVQIIAQGQSMKPTTGVDLAIGSITVGGDVKSTLILAGFDELLRPVNADASIGKVTVGRNWEASSLVAGAEDYGTAGYGNGDVLQSVGDTDLVARIASITIKRGVLGSSAAGDHFGFVAQQIDKLKIGSRAISLTAGPSNDDVAIGTTDDVRLLEVG